MLTPPELKYSRQHQWLRLDAGTGTVGITDFGQDQLGDLVYLDLPAVGTVVEQFSRIGEIESIKTVVELFTPIGGEVIEVNQAAVEKPEIVNPSPYEDGWLVRLRVADPSKAEQLLSAEEYEAMVAEEQG
jgi:glycine cleavage system H protein